MIKLRSLPLYMPLCILASTFVFPAVSQAQGVAPAVRIVSRIDESQLVTLRGNTHPFANAAHDQGKVADTLPMTDLILVLSRDPAQQAAFDAYVTSEYDQNSPNYHQWLTPDQIGEQFGPSQTDILTITNWLTGHGFTVSQITRDRMSIRFNGTATQVESTFHTEIHNLTVKGQAHIGNMSDPQIPASLATVVIGVKALHNFFPKPMHRMGQVVQRDAQSGKWARQAPVGALSSTGLGSAKPFSTAGAKSTLPLPSEVANSRSAAPQFGVNVEGATPYLVEDVGPWDFATIYNITPLWTAGIDGTGQTIAIAGTSAIDIGETNVTGSNGYNDVNTFRTFFNLPTGNSWNTPILVNGSPNGEQALQVCTLTSSTAPCNIDDLLENSLDVEWSASIAKNAQIVLVSTYPNSPSDDNLYDSESYIVDNVGNSGSPLYGVHVMNVSYGECELGMGTAGNVQYYDLWQTAAAEGLAVIVAAGDSGSASCDDGYDYAEGGLTVSGLASTPWNTAVGGTDFNWCAPQNFFNSPTTECTASPYWNTTNNSTNQSTAIGYVPEVPWNDSCANPLALTWEQDMLTEIYTGYTASDISTPEQGCNFIYDAIYEGGNLSYYYQYGTYLLDVVGGSGGASNCVSNTSTSTTTGTCTTTSGAGSTGPTTNPDNPSINQASVATYNNGWPKPSWQTGVTGIPNDGVRDLPDVSFFAADGYLSSSAYLICVSQDSSAYGTNQACSYSSNQEPVAQEVGGTSVATPAMAGIVALINQKTGAAQGSPNAQLYALAAKQTYSSTCSAENATTSDGCYFNDIDKYTNAQPCAAGSTNCTATQSTLGSADVIGILTGYTAGTGFDLATGLGSMNIANVVNAWTKATPGSTVPTVTVTPNPTSINSSNSLSVTVTVAGGTGSVPPTGSVTLTASGSTYTATDTLNNGSYTFTIPANSLPGNTTGESDTLTASYAGDVTYAAKTGTGMVTVTTSSTSLLTPTIAVSPASSTLNSSASLNVTVSVTGSGVIPTGTITLSASSGSYTATTETIGTAPCTSNTNCVFTIPANSLGSGGVTLTAKYSGDSNYNAGQNTGSVTVTESTFSLSSTPIAVSPTTVAPGSSAKATVTITPVAGYTGTVTLTCAQTGTTASGGDGTTCNPSGSDQVNLATCGASCSVIFTIGTYAPVTAALERPKLPGAGNKGPGDRELLGAGSGAILALLAFFGIPARRRSWRNMLSILVVMVAIGTLASCGGGSTNTGGGGQNDPGTTAGTYTYTVTASASPSVTPAVTQTFTVTVN
jgi:hypothetical protein